MVYENTFIWVHFFVLSVGTTVLPCICFCAWLVSTSMDLQKSYHTWINFSLPTGKLESGLSFAINFKSQITDFVVFCYVCNAVFEDLFIYLKQNGLGWDFQKHLSGLGAQVPFICNGSYAPNHLHAFENPSLLCSCRKEIKFAIVITTINWPGAWSGIQ